MTVDRATLVAMSDDEIFAFAADVASAARFSDRPFLEALDLIDTEKPMVRPEPALRAFRLHMAEFGPKGFDRIHPAYGPTDLPMADAPARSALARTMSIDWFAHEATRRLMANIAHSEPSQFSLAGFLFGACCLFASGNTALMVLRPQTRRLRGQLHSESGPAVVWLDGTEQFFWHGVEVPRETILDPGSITVEQILACDNAERQRVLIERYGWDRFDESVACAVIDHDEHWGTLVSVRPPPPELDPGAFPSVFSAAFEPVDPLLYVRVVNRSPEPDGTFRRYVLPVHPELRPLPDPEDPRGRLGMRQRPTALNAVASTFGMTGEEYAARLGAES